ncbi:MAG TPA: hypothetical protein VES62_11985 [Thermoleophilaceae bacterium]|nr:hypothetical protein [Thermoleophilaceae bacterium]
MHEVRKDGGELTLTDSEAEIPAGLEIFAITIPPVAGAESPAYEEAKAAFAENTVTELSPDQADRVGEHAAEALAALA